MKKIVVLFLAVSAVMLGSCSKDDENNGSLVGTWQSVKRVAKETLDNGEPSTKEETLDFDNCNGTQIEFTETEAVSTYKRIRSEGCKVTKKDPVTYTFDGKKLTFKKNEKDESYEVIKLTDKELVVFTKESGSNNNVGYIREVTGYFKRVK